MSLHFHRSGSGEPLLMLHGLFGSWENLGGPIKALQQQFDVIAPDMLNHGRSPQVDQFNYSTFADSVLTLADELGLQQFNLLGHSMGGKIAMELALNHPERVSRLIVVDIAPVQYPHHHTEVFKGLKQVPLNEIKSRTEADRHLSQHIESASIRAFLLKNLYRTESGFNWRMNLDALEREYDKIASPMSDAEYLGPTLFIKGSESDYIKPEYQNEVVKRFPKVQLRIIEGTGHWPHAEKPALFTKIVERFLHS
jgi:esterase